MNFDIFNKKLIELKTYFCHFYFFLYVNIDAKELKVRYIDLFKKEKDYYLYVKIRKENNIH